MAEGMTDSGGDRLTFDQLVQRMVDADIQPCAADDFTRADRVS